MGENEFELEADGTMTCFNDRKRREGIPEATNDVPSFSLQYLTLKKINYESLALEHKKAN